MRAVALRCPYCHCGIDPRDETIRCSKCRTIHHTSCWFENQHCSIFACEGDAFQVSSLPALIQIAPPVLLFFLALFPNGWSFFAPLLIPALLCSMIVIVRFCIDLIDGRFINRRISIEYALVFWINFFSIYCVIKMLVRQ